MKIQTIAKYVDQPVLLNKLQQKMPALLIGTGAAYGTYDTFKSPRRHSHEHPDKHKYQNTESRLKQGVKNAIIISSTITASLVGARGLKLNGKKIINGLMENTPLDKLLQKQSEAVDHFISNKKPEDSALLQILNKARTTHLSCDDIETLSAKLPLDADRESLFKVILPDKENLDSKEIFGEIKRLSLLGAIPVVGGIAGGIAADAVTHTASKKKTADKIKEGFYQYFANIFLCNVGAGAALFTAEQLAKAKIIKPLKPAHKLCTILAGITATGIVGGSFIANYLSKKLINPLFGQKTDQKLYDERKPELTDIALHADDIATAGVLSGFKWIEPALPLMYFVSGYRAGIGYRNVNN